MALPQVFYGMVAQDATHTHPAYLTGGADGIVYLTLEDAKAVGALATTGNAEVRAYPSNPATILSGGMIDESGIPTWLILVIVGVVAFVVMKIGGD